MVWWKKSQPDPPEAMLAELGAIAGELTGLVEVLRENVPDLTMNRDRRPKPRDKVIMWIIGTVLGGVLPLFFTWLSHTEHGSFTFTELLSKGDLVVVSIVIMIAGLAELVLVRRRIEASKDLTTAILELACAVFIGAASYWYGGLLSDELSKIEGTSAGSIMGWSLAIYGAGALLSSRCVWLAAEAE